MNLDNALILLYTGMLLILVTTVVRLIQVW